MSPCCGWKQKVTLPQEVKFAIVRQVRQNYYNLIPTAYWTQTKPYQKSRRTLCMLLYVKDRHNVSGDAYHEMAQLCNAMPQHYKLKQHIIELNRLWNQIINSRN